MIDGRTDGASSSPSPRRDPPRFPLSVVGGIGCCVTKRIALLRIFSTVIIGSTQRTTGKNCGAAVVRCALFFYSKVV